MIMNPINNSDTAWLIVSDYNQDNDLPYEDLREDIIDPETNQWLYDYRYVGIIGRFPMGALEATYQVGDDDCAGVGGCSSRDVGFLDENYVGGNPEDHYAPH